MINDLVGKQKIFQLYNCEDKLAQATKFTPNMKVFLISRYPASSHYRELNLVVDTDSNMVILSSGHHCYTATPRVSNDSLLVKIMGHYLLYGDLLLHISFLHINKINSSNFALVHQS